MIIIVTGSVGTGKTVISKALASRLNFEYIDVNKIIKENDLSGSYIPELDTYEVDVKKLKNFLLNYINGKEDLIIDGHLSHYLDCDIINFCIVCRCDLKLLKQRLLDRGYNELKIRENLDAEIFETCKQESLEFGHNLVEIDTTHKTVDECVED